jgi:menaquinol-cytochrome c reductase iron-sulfur subunit
MGEKTPSPSMSRREFVTIVTAFLGSIMGIVIGLPGIAYLVSPALKTSGTSGNKISLGPRTNYPVGTPTSFSFTRSKINGWEKTVNSYGVFVYRSSETELKVFSNICPHLACRVVWYDDKKEYICPCHDAHFGIEGNVLSGPPPRPMFVFPHEIDSSDNIIIEITEA